MASLFAEGNEESEEKEGRERELKKMADVQCVWKEKRKRMTLKRARIERGKYIKK